MLASLQILPIQLLNVYKDAFDPNWEVQFNALRDSELSADSFSFYTSVSAVFSSKIEGENIELDSFVKHKKFGAHFLPDYTQKIDDLYDAYSFAQEHALNQENMLKAHQMLSKHLLQDIHRGRIRTGNMYVITPDGRIEYVAASPSKVHADFERLWLDIGILLEAALTVAEACFFASMIHLVFVKIHPFDDGNGRGARLLEKWFLASKLGKQAWLLQSEKLYYQHHQAYYQHIRRLGLEYDTLDYSQALPFLQLLPKAVAI